MRFAPCVNPTQHQRCEPAFGPAATSSLQNALAAEKEYSRWMSIFWPGKIDPVSAPHRQTRRCRSPRLLSVSGQRKRKVAVVRCSKNNEVGCSCSARADDLLLRSHRLSKAVQIEPRQTTMASVNDGQVTVSAGTTQGNWHRESLEVSTEPRPTGALLVLNRGTVGEL